MPDRVPHDAPDMRPHQLAFEERQRIVNEYIDAIAEFPRVRMNTGVRCTTDEMLERLR